jgi:uncharacterized repeat protein (TIGR01451 family)
VIRASGRAARPAIVMVLLAAFVAVTVSTTGDAQAEASLPNPPAPDRCGLDVAIVVDTSQSISDPAQGGGPANPGLLTAAAAGFVDALTGTPSSISITSFRTAARTEIDLVDVRTAAGAAAVKAAIGAIDFSHVHPAFYPPGVPYPAPEAQAFLGDRSGTLGGTNWQDALTTVPSGAEVIVFITDGNPTTWAGDDDPGYLPAEPADLDAGVAAANAQKAAGRRIVGVGIGGSGSLASLSVDNLRAVSGPAENDDYYLTGFDGLGATLRTIATRLCAPSVNVVKYVEDADGGRTAAAGWQFAVSLSPVPPVAPPPVTTDAGGAASFRWTATGATTVTLSETLRAGYAFGSIECRDASGTSLPLAPAGTGATLSVGLDQIVSCTVINRLLPASLSVAKTARSGLARVGDLVTYDYTIRNTGQTTVANLTLADDVLGSLRPAVTTLAPGASTTVTATHPVTGGDLPGPLVNLATVGGTTPDGRTVTAYDEAVVPLASLTVVKTANPAVAAVGDAVTYTYTITNTGSVRITGIGLSDDRLGTLIPPDTSLAPGTSTTVTVVHRVRTASTTHLVNTAVTTGTATSDGTRVGVSGTDTAGVGIAAVDIAKTPDRPKAAVGQTITYSYRVTNTGSLPLTGLTVSDDVLGSVRLTVTTLAPGASTTATATHTVTPADGWGPIVNVATVTGTATPGDGGPGRTVEDTATASVTVDTGGGTTTTTTTTTSTTSTTTTPRPRPPAPGPGRPGPPRAGTARPRRPVEAARPRPRPVPGSSPLPRRRRPRVPAVAPPRRAPPPPPPPWRPPATTKAPCPGPAATSTGCPRSPSGCWSPGRPSWRPPAAGGHDTRGRDARRPQPQAAMASSRLNRPS